MTGLGVTQLSWGSGVFLFPNSSATGGKPLFQPLSSKTRLMLVASLARSAQSASVLLGYLDAQKVLWSWFRGISTSGSRGWMLLLMPTCILQWDKSILRFWSCDIMALISMSLPMQWWALCSMMGLAEVPQLKVTRQMFRQLHSRVL